MSFPASPDGLDIDTPHMMCILRVVPRNSPRMLPKDTPFPVYKQLATISFFLPFNPDRLLDSLDIILALWETSTDRAKSALTCSSRDVTLLHHPYRQHTESRRQLAKDPLALAFEKALALSGIKDL